MFRKKWVPLNPEIPIYDLAYLLLAVHTLKFDDIFYEIYNLGIFFVSFLKIYFNWRLITLHYCSGFCNTLT